MTVKVLIVDDQDSFRTVAAEVVRASAGFELVGEVGSGEDSVEAARRLRPDLVLMDVNLPGIDGPEASRRIRAERAEVIVFLLSTHDPEDLASRLRGSGATKFISKDVFGSESLANAWHEAGEPAH